MPVEYYLGAFVAVVILVLLVSLLRGASRRKLANDSDTTQLTQQLTRIADSLEALLIQLKASSIQPAQSAPIAVQPSLQAIPQREPAQALPQTLPPSSQEPAPATELEQPAQQKAAEASVAAPAKAGEPAKPSKQHVVLSMFGR